MAREFTYVCDGCGAKKTSTSPKLPQFWADVEVHVTGIVNSTYGGDNKDRHFSRLLCSHCQITIVEQADPSKWPRAAQEKQL